MIDAKKRKVGKTMNKKAIIGLLIVILAASGIGGYFVLSNKDRQNENDKNSVSENNNSNNTEKDNNDDNTKNEDNAPSISGGGTLIVYYSATGSTKKVAEEISKNLDADLFEIEPVDEYTSDDLDWTDKNSRVSKEHDDESLRDVKLKNTKVDNWDSYDTVLIGYPIWWGVAAWPVDVFVKANNFDGKKVIPFCTSASSSLGQNGDLLAKEANSGNWVEGHRFSSGTSSSDIKTWIDGLK